jgi:hypothetical protein
VGLEVRSAHPWVLVEDKFQFDYLDISFMMNTPGSPDTTVHWNLKSEMKIGESVKIITGVDSDLNVSAELAEAVPIKPILNQYYPAADLDLTVDGLRVELAFARKPPDWHVYVSVSSTWQIVDNVTVESIRFKADGQGTTPKDISIRGQLLLGDAELFLGGEMNEGAGWDLTGRMAHKYNEKIVPNPDFDPSKPGTTPMKTEHVEKKSSHFFANIFDKLFPGGTSGVPPMLDVDIKKLEIKFNTQSKDFHFNTELEFGKNVDTVLTKTNQRQANTEPPENENRATPQNKVIPNNKQPDKKNKQRQQKKQNNKKKNTQ